MIKYEKFINDAKANIRSKKVKRQVLANNPELAEKLSEIALLIRTGNIEEIENRLIKINNAELQQLAEFANLDLNKYTDKKIIKLVEKEEQQKESPKISQSQTINNTNNNNEENNLKQELNKLRLENKRYKQLFDFKNKSEYISFDEEELQKNYEEFILTNQSQNVFKLDNKIVIIKEGYIIDNEMSKGDV